MPELAELGRRAPEQRGPRSSRRRGAPGAPCRASSPGGRCGRRTRRGSRAGAGRASSPPPCAGRGPRTRRACGTGTAAASARRARPPRCSPRRRPWRIACWRSGRARRPAALGRDRARPRRRRWPTRCRWPFTRIVASVSMRSPFVSGRPSCFTIAGRAARRRSSTPCASARARRSRARRCARPCCSSVVPVRISIPRRRSSCEATSARLSGISGMIRSSASTRIQRVPATRQRGYCSIVSFT